MQLDVLNVLDHVRRACFNVADVKFKQRVRQRLPATSGSGLRALLRARAVTTNTARVPVLQALYRPVMLKNFSASNLRAETRLGDQDNRRPLNPI